jgi:hypothetical protein
MRQRPTTTVAIVISNISNDLRQRRNSLCECQRSAGEWFIGALVQRTLYTGLRVSVEMLADGWYGLNCEKRQTGA